MKKQCIIMAAALMLTVGAVCGAGEKEAKAATVAINKKNFPDQVFRELVRVNYDKNKDKKLSDGEIKNARKFGSSSCKNTVKIKPSKYAKYQKKYVKDIKSFKGIGKLTNLQKFVANETTVKTIDLKKNKNLVYLEMTDGKLQKLNLNKNLKLKYVYLEYNQLTSLTMNKCKKLIDVDLTGHMVKKLKIFHNKKTNVIGEDYYQPYSATKIKESFNFLNDGGALDVNGNYCIYEWNEDYSGCVKKTLTGTSMTSNAINLNSDTIYKAKAMQNITAQWQDAQGNFYFVADKDGDMVAKTVNYLYKVNPQGAIEQEIVLNDQISFSESYNNRYNLYFMNQKNGVAALKMTTGSNVYGVMYFDMNTMKVSRQVECDFEPYATEGDTVVGSKSYDVVVSKIPAGREAELENGEKIEVCQLSATHRISIPIREDFSAYSIGVKNNYVYLISSKGFFRAKLTAKSFTQLYGIGKISGMQDSETTYQMTMNSEKEIVLLFADKKEGKVSHRLVQCKI
ncbi:MAG: hypothetical protein J1F02_00165 [Lachnospiraceae bacterium]|nr:hypothetical protein [Lachnospiraceae bacterium]